MYEYLGTEITYRRKIRLGPITPLATVLYWPRLQLVHGEFIDTHRLVVRSLLADESVSVLNML